MKNEIARREIESLDYYLQNHTNDYSEESHTAMMMAIKALEQEPCEDTISRQAVLDGLANIAKAKARSDAQKALMGRVMFFTEKLPSVNPQKPICPSAGIDCEDCPAYEDAISRKAVLEHICGINGLEGIESSNVFEKHYADFIKSLPSVKPKSEWQHDHEILKAHSDGANAVLDKIRDEIEHMIPCSKEALSMKLGVLEIIDRYTKDGE